jgi:transcriptional regulator with XRE-family HTH domain
VKHEDVLEILRQDPGYVEAEERLRPILEIAADVIRLREEKGWTQAELARRVGTRQANISRLENGLCNPTLNFLRKVARALDTELIIHIGTGTVQESAKTVTETVVRVVQPEAIWGIKHAQYPSSTRWSGFAPPSRDNSELNPYKAA